MIICEGTFIQVRTNSTRMLASSPTTTFSGSWPGGITNPRPTPQQKSPCFKLAHQSPKPLDHRNWPIVLFLLDLLTASSENRQFKSLILFIFG